MLVRVALLSVACLLLQPLAAMASPVTFNWFGTLTVIDENVPPSTFDSVSVGTLFTGSVQLDDACPASSCLVNNGTPSSSYSFQNGFGNPGDGGTLSFDTTSRLLTNSSVFILDDDPLTAAEAGLLSQITGTTIAAATPVDGYVLLAQEFTAGVRFSIFISFLSFDLGLYSDTDFRLAPPLPSEVDLTVFTVLDVSNASPNFVGGGQLFVPEPGTAGLLAVSLGLLGLARARHGARSGLRD